jgi:glycosyltransferase involved in cell wall biosynthesis
MATILYFSKDYTPHDHRFLSALAETEHRVAYLRLERGPRQTEDRPVPPKIEEIPWEGGRQPASLSYGPRLLCGLRRVLRELKPDLVHAGPIQTCGLLAALTGFRPLLIMSWGFDLMQDAGRNARWRWATSYTLRRATAFTSDCEVTRRKALAYGVPEDRTVVFPWGVDLEHFKPGTAERDHGFTLFCNRSWEPRYGVDMLAQAFVLASRQCPDLHLLLLGGGSQAACLRQILEQGGDADRVTFAGQVSQAELPRYYRMADVYISPSHVDGSSVSLMEALACGVPCLVSDIPANLEWVAEGQNGWLFPDGDVAALATAMLKAYENRKSLPALGRAARSVAEAKADWSKNFPKLLEAYALAIRLKR